jgi:hypothetical protein
VAETNTPQQMDAAEEYLLYYESGVNVYFVIVLKPLAVLITPSKWLKLKEFPDGEM